MSNTIDYQVGWFGVPGRDNGTKTHLVANGKPVCKVRLHAKSEFQWCGNGLNTFKAECTKCRVIQQRLLTATIKKIMSRMTVKTKHVADYGFIPLSMFTYPKYASHYYRTDSKQRMVTIVSNGVDINISRFTLTPAQWRKYTNGNLSLVPPDCVSVHDIEHLDNPTVLFNGEVNNFRHLKNILKDLNIQPKNI